MTEGTHGVKQLPITVLLVDDQPIVAEAIRRMLLAAPDLTLHYNPKPEDAVAVASQIQPTVILQDLVMPGTSGLTLLRNYRAEPVLRDVPVIVLSMKDEPAVKSEAFSLGASDYLVKLPDAIELVARLRLHARVRQNQLQRDEAHAALCESQRQLVASNRELAEQFAELHVARDELSRAVNIDALTGLASRRRWFELAAAEFARYQRYGRPFALLIADLDLFKRINDTFGHDGGDRVLTTFATVLREASRDIDVAGRIGGEEFVMLLPETTAGGAQEVAHRIIEACRLSSASSVAARITFSCSIGVTEALPQDKTCEDVLKRADLALYDAKHQGRDRWVFRAA
jgi:two-component system, chemotaxis family, response regulator WspR